MHFIPPIFDRTYDDVRAAYNQQYNSEKYVYGSFKYGTVKYENPYVTTDFKGCLNASDANRIENNTEYIARKASEYGYPIDLIYGKWEMSDLPRVSDIDRMLYNIDALRNKLYVYKDTPAVPDSLLSYTEANDTERILYDIESIIDKIAATFMYCGEAFCGGTDYD